MFFKRNISNNSLSLNSKKNMMGYFFIIPFLIGLVAIFIPSIIQSFYYSFSDVEIGFDKVSIHIKGVSNYINAFTEDTDFRVYLLDAVKGIFVDLITIILFSFFISFILNQKFFGRGAARVVFFLPILLSSGFVASADFGNSLMESYSSANNSGSVIATAFSGGGLAEILDLKSLLESTNLNTGITDFIINAIDNTYEIVNSSGVQILIFLSALQNISDSIYESARVEGATKWEEFWKITFPMLTPMILVNIVYTIIDSFINPRYQILEYIENNSFVDNQMGYASALSWIYFAVTLVIVGVLWKIISKRVQYLD